MKAKLVKRFEDQIAELERELKTELPKEIQKARELGDLRENAEYKAAKERQEFVNARIAMLKKRAGEIALMNVDKLPRDKAGLGSSVTLLESTGERMEIQLVMPEDADVERGHHLDGVSDRPCAIVHREVGDEVTVTMPNGSRTFELMKLVTIHDLAPPRTVPTSPTGSAYSPRLRTAHRLHGDRCSAGAYHAGVVKALAEAGIRVDVVSRGAAWAWPVPSSPRSMATLGCGTLRALARRRCARSVRLARGVALDVVGR